ncbi:uncharacterized protein PpBr36_05715 [Pyricularia pennisetigena]|uniref:uncharacterized protein n=1 Tax=Pyricularia pennisetigena TaxID=1578925 RepID=UPI0011510EE2|nr:uncharacterized protein PpBr36_05715 [Pyricularia pennisetigena]TLS23517.1 hypothetical protein PpBr36_05715 [Pyricularia pennisetigena]
MGRVILFLFALLHSLPLIVGAEVTHTTQGQHAVVAQAEVAPGGGDGGQSATAREPGADLVDAAVHELRKIQGPAHHHRKKRPGFFGQIARLVVGALPTFRLTAPAPSSSSRAPTGQLAEAIKLLEESAGKNNSDALYLLAEMSFYGNFSHPIDLPRSYNYYQRLADTTGNSSAMYMIGLMYSTGVGRAVEPDQAKALLYYTFAALQGHTRAEMAVGARHSAGIGTPKNCEQACKYYKRVADKAIAWYRSGPPGGMSWSVESHRISDDFGGVYGEGASVSSAGINGINARSQFNEHASIGDIIEYLDLMVHKGDFQASFNLGRIYYEGQRGLDRDLVAARRYFRKVVNKYWLKGGGVIDNAPPQLEAAAGKAAGYLGRMYLRGDGVDQDFERARFWFNRGIKLGEAQSQFGLGMMLLHGYGQPKNLARATDLLKAAAGQNHASANVQLGALYLDQGGPEDIRAANDCFEQAARYGNIEAQYYLAEMISHGAGRDRSCSQALSFYRSVAEKAEPVVSSWLSANHAYEDGDLEAAFLQYLGTAEQGYERAQNNVAFLLDAQKSLLPLPDWLTRKAPTPELLKDPALGLIYWTRSSRQGNIDSLVKMGDYYLQGTGTEPDVDKAVQCYQGAADYHQSAQALYNLGWMHEHGIGLDQDYHLAKRYYDEALMTNDEAYLPVTLALFKLRAKSAWNTLTNGGINSIQDEPVQGKDWSWGEWVANFLREDYFFEDDAHFDDNFDHTMPGGDAALPAELDEGLVETLIILGLAAALAFLVYYRQHRQQQHREENARRLGAAIQQQALQQQAAVIGGAAGAGGNAQADDRGVFPPPDDPEFRQWVAGGILRWRLVDQNTMNTPAAKRRRIEATKTLKKPFRSPLISRRGGDKEEAKTGSGREGVEDKSFKDAVVTDHGTNTVAAATAPSAGAAPSSLASPSPLRTKVPRRAVDTRAPFKSPSVAISSAAALGAKEPQPNHDSKPDGTTSKEGPLSQVAAGAVVRPSDKQLKRENGDAAGAAADGDDELRHLIGKWKAASRLAAEMVFDIAKQRVDSAGGPKAWREQQKSWDEPASGMRGSDDGEGRELGGENQHDYDGSTCSNNDRVSDDEYEPASFLLSFFSGLPSHETDSATVHGWMWVPGRCLKHFAVLRARILWQELWARTLACTINGRPYPGWY